MKNNFLQEIVLSFLLIILLLLFLNPFGWWMSSPALMMSTGILVVLFALFASFIWREQAQDEREALHALMAGRVAFLSGMGVLIIAVVVQSFQHSLDYWLVIALGVMILVKIGTLMYNKRYR